MKRSAYREQDYAFGQAMLTLRSMIGLTQTGLADFLGVSRRAVGAWEAGSKYPKAPHLKQFIALAVENHAFPAGHEAEEIRALWKAARQKVLLDERWLAELLRPTVANTVKNGAFAPILSPPVGDRYWMKGQQAEPDGLPFQPTPFIGRGAELGEITRILADPACRLLTLIGPGGIGKTRLALEVAAHQMSLFADGVAFVALASISAPNEMVTAIGDSLNLSFNGGADLTSQLIGYLRERRLLLVLDNFEHLLDGADLVYDIIRRAPYVNILVTSRVRLELQAEWLFDVEGLSYPEEGLDTLPSPADLAGYSAIQLFAQRVAQIQPGFSLTASNLDTIVRICQQVAGMPLAIELAAAGVRTNSIDEIEERIHANLDALSTTLRDVPPRHRSMRAVFDHSWNLLGEPERALFSRLAIFRGGCTTEAAQQVAGATLPTLLTLVDKSLLRQSSEVEPRFTFLEPVREYALEKLAARGEVQALQRAHAAYYQQLAETAAAQWDTPTVDSAIELLNREHDNLRAALQWTLNGGDLTVGLQLGGALWRFWRGSGYINEGRLWLADLLEQNDDSTDATALAARLRAVHGAAWLASDQHDFEQAAWLFEEGTSLRRALGKTEDETNFLLNAARQARAAGQYQRAITLLEDALSRQRALGNRGSSGSAGQGLSLYELALMLREQGEFARAAALYQECMDFHREIGDREGMYSALLGLGDVARDQGDADGVRKYTEPSLAFFRDLGIQWAIGFALNNLAQAAYLDDDLPQASALIHESVSLFRDLKDDGGLAEVLITLGCILRAQGSIVEARDALTESLRLASVVGPRLLVAAALEGLAGVMTQSGEARAAVQGLAAASELRTAMGAPVRPADQPAIDHALATAQTILGVDAFRAVWSEATALPLEQSISAIFNLASDDALLPEPQPVEESPITISTPVSPEVGGTRRDWGDALSTPTFYGRERELKLLTGWVVEERCRVVSLLGLGGIGKSTLAVNLMRHVAGHFEVVIWRSLLDIPTCEILLQDLLTVLAPQTLEQVPASFEQRLSLLLEKLRAMRVLLVLDNLESVLEEGENEGRMRPGYEGFGRFLHQTAETEHQSCVLLTSREKPNDLVTQEGSHTPVRAFRVGRLDTEACEQLLAQRGVTGSLSEQARLIEAYAGNPLALKIVAQTIADLFDGELAPFLEQGELIFGSIRELLAVQFNRLSMIEQRVVLWLAILREPSTIDELFAVLVTPVPRVRLLEAIEGLHRRSLIERGHKPGSFTLQSVVLEYVTMRLIAETTDEIAQGHMRSLTEYGFELAQTREYVRQNQERLIVAPIVANLRSTHPRPGAVEDVLLALLDQLRTLPFPAHGYGPANLVTLLRLQRGHLRGLDLSRLVLHGAYLQGVEMQDTTLAGATIRDCVFTETFDALTGVAISRTGEYWAAASRRGEIRVWAAGGQNLIRAWQAHANMIYHLAFSPDGHTLASGGWGGMVKLWNVDNGALLWSGRHTSRVNNVAFSPDGRLLSSSGDDATVRLWDRENGLQLHVLPHPEPVAGDGATWSPDGRLFASGDLNGMIRLWQVSKTEPPGCVQTLAAHANWVDGLAFSPDGNILASASFDGTVKLWEIPGGRLIQTLTGHTNRVYRVVWSPDGRTLASSSFDQTILLWDVEQNQYRAALRGHTAGVVGLAFTPDSRNLLSAGEDGTLRVWDTVSLECLHVKQGYAESLYDIDWSPDGTKLVAGGSDTLVTIWDLSGKTPPRTLRGHRGVVTGVRWSSDARWLASGEWDNAILLWNPISQECVRVLHYPDDDGNFFDGFAWSPDGQLLATATYRHGVQVFDMATQHYRWDAHSFPTWIRRVVWSPDGTRLAGGGEDGILYLWDAADVTLLHQLAGHRSAITQVAWSPDGTQLASGGGGMEEGELLAWDPQRGQPIHAVVDHPGIVHAIAWVAGANLLVSGGADGKLRWWDMQAGTCLQERQAHEGTIHSLRRSPDGHKLASCGNDGAIMLWDLQSSEYLQTLRRDRPYERLNIMGIVGLTEAHQATLRRLGAIEKIATPNPHLTP